MDALLLCQVTVNARAFCEIWQQLIDLARGPVRTSIKPKSSRSPNGANKPVKHKKLSKSEIKPRWGRDNLLQSVPHSGVFVPWLSKLGGFRSYVALPIRFWVAFILLFISSSGVQIFLTQLSVNPQIVCLEFWILPQKFNIFFFRCLASLALAVGIEPMFTICRWAVLSESGQFFFNRRKYIDKIVELWIVVY